MKTEPSTFSWDDLKAKGKVEWDGVRSYEARNNMKKGELVFIYHSVKKPEIVGIAKVVAEAHPDSTDTTGVWWCVDVAPVKKLERPVSLQEIKAMLECAHMELVKKSRLSVSPVTEHEWKVLLSLVV